MWFTCVYTYIHIFSQDKIVCAPTALHLGGAPSFLVHLSHWNWMLQGSWVSLVNLTEELVIGVDLCLDNESGVCVWDSALCLGEMLMKRQQLSGSSDSTVRSVTMHHSCSWSNMIIWSRMEILWNLLTLMRNNFKQAIGCFEKKAHARGFGVDVKFSGWSVVKESWSLELVLVTLVL